MFPRYLARLGYQTHMIGKWHLGFGQASELPTGRGFSSFLGHVTRFGVLPVGRGVGVGTSCFRVPSRTILLAPCGTYWYTCSKATGTYQFLTSVHFGAIGCSLNRTSSLFRRCFRYWNGAEDYYSHDVGSGYDFALDTATAYRYSGAYSTDVFTARAVELLEQAAADPAAAPRFIYLCYQAVYVVPE